MVSDEEAGGTEALAVDGAKNRPRVKLERTGPDTPFAARAPCQLSHNRLSGLSWGCLGPSLATLNPLVPRESNCIQSIVPLTLPLELLLEGPRELLRGRRQVLSFAKRIWIHSRHHPSLRLKLPTVPEAGPYSDPSEDKSLTVIHPKSFSHPALIAYPMAAPCAPGSPFTMSDGFVQRKALCLGATLSFCFHLGRPLASTGNQAIIDSGIQAPVFESSQSSDSPCSHATMDSVSASIPLTNHPPSAKRFLLPYLRPFQIATRP